MTRNFVISYQTVGDAAVDNDLSDFEVIEPGSKPHRVMASLPGGTVPAYVRLVAFWLERSLQFLATLQYTEAGTQHFAQWYRPRIVGAFHLSPTDGNLRIDHTAPAVTALVGYVEQQR